jgi:hypothetical protein
MRNKIKMRHTPVKYSQAFSKRRLTSSCSIFLLIEARSYDFTIDYFLSFDAVVMNLTAASFSFEIKSTGQLPLCFIKILGTYILSSESVKYGCLSAYAAEILSSGSFCSIFLRRSTSKIKKKHYIWDLVCQILALSVPSRITG